jgi:exportin-2 (importin alpha re-exporter)
LRFVRFYYFVSSLNDPKYGYGTDYFIAASDSVQDGAFVPVYLTIILPCTQQITKPVDRKIAAISLTKTLTDSQKFAERYVKGWTLTLEALVKLLELAPMPVADGDAVVEQDVDDLAFGVGFTQLNTCKRQPKDSSPEITDIKSWIGQYYRQGGLPGAGSNAQDLMKYVQERTSPEMRKAFSAYLNA